MLENKLFIYDKEFFEPTSFEELPFNQAMLCLLFSLFANGDSMPGLSSLLLPANGILVVLYNPSGPKVLCSFPDVLMFFWSS